MCKQPSNSFTIRDTGEIMLKRICNGRTKSYIGILTYEELLEYVTNPDTPERNKKILDTLHNLIDKPTVMPTLWFKDPEYTVFEYVTYSSDSFDENCDKGYEWAIYDEDYDIKKCPVIMLLLSTYGE